MPFLFPPGSWVSSCLRASGYRMWFPRILEDLTHTISLASQEMAKSTGWLNDSFLTVKLKFLCNKKNPIKTTVFQLTEYLFIHHPIPRIPANPSKCTHILQCAHHPQILQATEHGERTTRVQEINVLWFKKKRWGKSQEIKRFLFVVGGEKNNAACAISCLCVQVEV